ncbi:hypothetical protein PsorP6_003294 [Peronosclerospora sorghi]|uniref:Uncharacterized protein n=1 Tax=Peronosclerospora sorghi TaxID=230839 RepID=A0ACC0VM08_9STRA|nr:hypothetical protein PsorP6_003294 [Peronosclerospora sorghi]
MDYDGNQNATLKPSSLGTAQAVTGLSSTDVKKKNASSLLQFGYFIISSCAMIILLTFVYLYRRVFHGTRPPYINLEQATHSRISGRDPVNFSEHKLTYLIPCMVSPFPEQPPTIFKLELHESPSNYLPQNWSYTDQQIFETLLLPPPSSASMTDVSDSSTSVKSEPLSITKKFPAGRKRVSVEEKRMKHREVQRRFMLRKKEMLASVKKSIVALELQMAVLKLSSQRKALEMENKTLQQEKQILGEVMPSVVTRKVLEEIFQREAKAVEHQFKPFSVQQWQEIVCQTLHNVDQFLTQEAMEGSGLNVMGWSDRRHVEDTTVKFTLHKAFPNVFAEKLWNTTWQALSTDCYASFFSPSLFIRRHLLQKVCDDAIIIYRVISYPQTGRVSRGIEIMSRVRRDLDFVYFVRTLDLADVRERLFATDVWTQSLTVLRFMPSDLNHPDVGCVISYGGNYANIPKGGVKYWLMEVLFMVLRFESTLISPVFSLGD